MLIDFLEKKVTDTNVNLLIKKSFRNNKKGYSSHFLVNQEHVSVVTDPKSPNSLKLLFDLIFYTK